MTKPFALVLVNLVFLFLSASMDIVEYYTEYDVGILADVFWKLAAMLGPISILVSQT